EWPLTPDAEVKVAGWWGRLEQFRSGDRVWVWLQLDRGKRPVAVAMLADEPSEQDVHGASDTVVAWQDGQLNVRTVKGVERTLKLADAEIIRGKDRLTEGGLAKGDHVYV